MELRGRVKAYDENTKPHEFNVYRGLSNYIIQLDGEQIARADTHLEALDAIVKEATRRGCRKGPGS